MTTKADLHQIIEALPDSETDTAARYLKAIQAAAGDPGLLALLLALEDDEPETAEERAAVAEAREDVKAGRVVSHEEMLREFGAA